MATTQDVLAASTNVAKNAAKLIGQDFTQGVGTTPDVLAQSTKVAQEAAKTIGKGFQQGVGVVDASQVGSQALNLPQKTENSKSQTAGDVISTRVGNTPTTDQAANSIDQQLSSFVSSIQDPETRNMTSELFKTAFSLGGLQGQYGQVGEQILGNLFGAQSDVTAKKARSRELQLQQGIPELQSELESIKSEADVVKATTNSQIQAAVRSTGVTPAQLQARVTNINRQSNLDLANLAIRELSATGRINAANALIQNKLDLEFGDVEEQVQLYQAQLQAIEPFVGREFQEKLQMRQTLMNEMQNQITNARQNAQKLEEYKLQTVGYMQRNGATPTQIKAVQDANSISEAQSRAGTLGLDPSQLLADAANRKTLNQQPTAITEVSGKKYLVNTQTGAVISQIAGDANADTATIQAQLAEARDGLDRVNRLLSDTGSIGASTGLVQSPFLSKLATNVGLGAAGGFAAGSVVPGLGNLAGTLIGGAAGLVTGTIRGAGAKVAKQDFLNGVTYIVNDTTFNKLLSLKAGGATFGSLSDSERAAIGRAANELNASATIDEQGHVTGFTGSPERFVANLLEVKKGYEAAQQETNIQYGVTADEITQIINTP